MESMINLCKIYIEHHGWIIVKEEHKETPGMPGPYDSDDSIHSLIITPKKIVNPPWKNKEYTFFATGWVNRAYIYEQAVAFIAGCRMVNRLRKQLGMPGNYYG